MNAPEIESGSKKIPRRVILQAGGLLAVSGGALAAILKTAPETHPKKFSPINSDGIYSGSLEVTISPDVELRTDPWENNGLFDNNRADFSKVEKINGVPIGCAETIQLANIPVFKDGLRYWVEIETHVDDSGIVTESRYIPLDSPFISLGENADFLDGDILVTTNPYKLHADIYNNADKTLVFSAENVNKTSIAHSKDLCLE